LDLASFLPQISGFAFTIVSFVAVISIIVAVHEYGHYIVGRWSGIHAEVFSLGFGPVLCSRVDRHGTRWQIALLPFGGFVKFLGDANAASGKDADAMAEIDPAQLRRTMHGAPLWARAATVAAGPVFNFVLSAVIFTVLILSSGAARDPLTVGQVIDLPAASTGEVYGLQAGDEILAVEGIKVPSLANGEAWTRFTDAIPMQEVLGYRVLRDGVEQEVAGPVLSPTLVRFVAPRSAASDINLQPGDVITAIDGAPVYEFSQLREAVEGGNGAPLVLNIWRNGAEFEETLTPRRTDEPQPDGGFEVKWRIGIGGGMAFDPATETVGVGTAIGSGVAQVGNVIQMSLSGLGHMILGNISTCNLSGPIGIAETSGAVASQGIDSFFRLVALISAGIGMLNLFPIPALDGGHLVFYAYEAVAGRPPRDRVMQVLMTVGIALVLSMMVFSLSNDLFC